jgi:hypothetical protein
MVVDAVLALDELLPLDMIGIKKVAGGALEVRNQLCPLCHVNLWSTRVATFGLPKNRRLLQSIGSGWGVYISLMEHQS